MNPSENLRIMKEDGSTANAFEVLNPAYKLYGEWSYHNGSTEDKLNYWHAVLVDIYSLFKQGDPVVNIKLLEELIPIFTSAKETFVLPEEVSNALINRYKEETKLTDEEISDIVSTYETNVKAELSKIPITPFKIEEVYSVPEGTTPEELFIQIVTVSVLETIELQRWDQEIKFTENALSRGIHFTRDEVKLLYGINMIKELTSKSSHSLEARPTWIK